VDFYCPKNHPLYQSPSLDKYEEQLQGLSMAHKIKIQDGVVVYENSDKTLPLDFYVHGVMHNVVADQLTVGYPTVPGQVTISDSAPNANDAILNINGDIFQRAFYSKFGSVSEQLSVGEPGIPATGINIIGENTTSTGYISTDTDQALIIQSGDNADLTIQSGVGGHILLVGPIADNINMVANATVTGVPTPVSGTDVANKNYVDAAINGLTWKQPVIVATTTSILLNGLQTIDGVSVNVGDRVLVKDQVDQTTNGIYDASSGVWVRTADASTGSELVGAAIYVEEGTTHRQSQWTQSTPSVTIGVTNIVWVQFGSQAVYSAGAGLSLVGTQFSITATGVSPSVYTSVVVNSQGQVISGSQIVSSDVTNALGYTPYNSSNPANYLTSATGVRKLIAGTNISISPASGFGDVTVNLSGAITATNATNLSGGGSGRVVYQAAANTTAFTSVGVAGQALVSGGSGAPTWTGSPSFTGSVSGAFFICSVSNSVTATGLTQGTAAVLSSQLNVVTTSVAGNGLGVQLPVGVPGMQVIIINESGNTINIYPSVGAQIEFYGTNIPQQLSVSAKLMLVAVSATQWYTMTATYA